MEDGDYDRALKSFEELMGRDPPSTRFRFEAGRGRFHGRELRACR